MPRRLKPPTLSQWGCQHPWRVRHTTRLPGPGPAKHRNYRCSRCGLARVTEERPAVPWDERALVELVKALVPAGKPVYLRDQGITTLPLYGLNTLLETQGVFMHAAKVRRAERFVACVDKTGESSHLASLSYAVRAKARARSPVPENGSRRAPVGTGPIPTGVRPCSAAALS